MKIGYFITLFPYNYQFKRYLYGGSSLAAYHLAREMAKRGHAIDVFTTSVTTKSSIEQHENLTIHRYGTNFKVLTSNISLGIFREPSRHNVDIVHTHFDIAPTPFAGLLYAQKKNAPHVVTYHGDWVATFGGLLRRMGVAFLNKSLVDKVLSQADVIISPSHRYAESSRFLSKYKNKTVVIPNGINLKDWDIPYSKEECRNKLGLPLNKKIMLFFGYLTPYKGPDVLVRAMPAILKTIPNGELVIVGTGTMYDELIAISKRLGVAKHSKFVGFVDDYLKPLYYRSADVFVLPSTMRTENFPIANLEAMACGIPIVASNIGGIPDVVKDGENGLLIPPNDVKLLAAAMIRLLGDEDEIERMGKNGRTKIVDYSWKNIAEKTNAIYNDILN
jgi:glycosyltransferase involved in cell wall biosynthesis